MFAIIVPPIAAIFLLGVFYRRGNGQGAFATLLAGFAMGGSGEWSSFYGACVALAGMRRRTWPLPAMSRGTARWPGG